MDRCFVERGGGCLEFYLPKQSRAPASLFLDQTFERGIQKPETIKPLLRENVHVCLPVARFDILALASHFYTLDGAAVQNFHQFKITDLITGC